MADNEHYSPDSSTGLPRVSPDAIRAYKSQSHSLNDDYERLRRSNPDLAFELATGTIGIYPDYIRLKQAFAEGALWMFHMLSSAAEADKLEALLHTPTSDGDDDEDQLPSV